MTSYTRYQSDVSVAEYCYAHYGPENFGVANFPGQIAKLCFEVMKHMPRRSALDLGCAVGRTSFELAVNFDQVTGVDYSSCFIEIACRIKRRGRINYRLIEEGEIISDHKVSLADLVLAETAEKVTFCQGNAQCLDDKFCGYDLVLTANLIDRLPKPMQFLSSIHQRLNAGGLLAIASPYDWLEQYTPKKHWLGGRFQAGKPVSSLNGARKCLRKHFSMVGEPRDVEFVIRKTSRTFSHGISQVTFWRKNT